MLMPKIASHLLEQLQLQFASSADWRRATAKRYDKPWDKGNQRAAECLERLAATCAQVRPQWVEAYEKLYDWDNNRAYSMKQARKNGR
jgi:hypothetical protein